MYVHRKRNTSMGGIINTCEAKDVNLKPIMIASGGCSGTVLDKTYNVIINEIIEGSNAGNVHGRIQNRYWKYCLKTGKG